jgi:DNA-binding SARP family transcriptional activator
LLLVDLRHREHLFVAQRQIVRLAGMRLDALDQLSLVLGANLDTTGTPHDLPHRRLRSRAVRTAGRILPDRTCTDFAVGLQDGDDSDEEAMVEVPAVRVYVCGRLAIEFGETVLRETVFPARQGRRLWTYLVLHRRWPVGRDELAGAIWGDAVPDAWHATLSALVSRLRAALRPLAAAAPGLAIRSQDGRYWLTLPAGAVVDHERARAALHAAETALRSGDIAVALSESLVATGIAARGFLGGEEAPWIEGERRALADLRLHALECTVEAELRRGNAAGAEREAERLLLLDPLRESSYRLLMRALAAGGNAAQAVRVMETCRRTLRDEGGLSPSAETEFLFREVTAPR